MTAIIGVLLTGAAILTLAWTFQRSLIYFPFGAVPSPSAVGLDAVEPISFVTDDGIRLGGWFVTSRTSPSRGTLVVFNGNAGNRAYRVELARAFREQGVACCCSTTGASEATAAALPKRGWRPMPARPAPTWPRGLTWT